MTTLHDVHLVPLDGAAGTGPVDVEFEDTITALRPATGTSMLDAGQVDVGRAAGGHVDGGGRFLVPGLIDTHVHLGSPEALTAATRAGITTVVDLGTHPDELIEAQRARSGAPSILSAGSAASAPGSTQISMMGFPAESGVHDPADASRYLDWRVRHGADLIKIIVEDPAATDVPALDIATLTALASGAHERGLLTVAHVVTAAAFDRALGAGVDVLTHAPLDRPLADSTIRRMAEQGAVASPTLVMMQVMAEVHGGEQAEAMFGNALESVRAMHAAGIPIVVGTDANETPFAPVAHGPSAHDEIALLRRAGLTTEEVLRAATSGAADAFGLGDRGRLEVGRRADLVLVDRDPRTDPEILRSPAAVWIGGVQVA
jgi:imidazolonepropionase-like amidohydrolase